MSELPSTEQGLDNFWSHMSEVTDFFHWFWAHIFNVEKNSNRHEVRIENHNVHHVHALKVTKQNYDSACYKCESSDTVLKSAETAVRKQIAKLDVYVQ